MEKPFENFQEIEAYLKAKKVREDRYYISLAAITIKIYADVNLQREFFRRLTQFDVFIRNRHLIIQPKTN
jgi:hypothetical protein